jgi:hypothetical protein
MGTQESLRRRTPLVEARPVVTLRRLLARSLVISITCYPLLAPVALAQPAAQASAERLEKARKHMEEGQSLYAQKRYLDAAQAFQLAYTAQPFAAFLFNEAVCYEKAGELDRALTTFKRYLAADPNPPDAPALQARIQRIEAQLGARTPLPAPTEDPRGGDAMHSLLVFESNPPGAPAQVWQKVDPSAPPFAPQKENKGWKQVSSGPTPLVSTLAPGHYHVVVDRWRAYNRSDDEVDVASGRVVQYRASLSQGEFMGFLRVTVEAAGEARIFLNEPPSQQGKPWGVAPHGELIPRGKHRLWVEAPGFETLSQDIEIDTGEQKNLQIKLQRLDFGYLLLEGNAPKVTFYLDGQLVGTYLSEDGPLKVKASQGAHRLKAVSEDKKPYDGDVEVAGGQAREVRVVLSSRPGRGLGWTTAALSAATLGAGVYLGLRSRGLLEDLRADRRAGHLAPGDDRVGEGKTYAILANVGFVSSALLAGVATYGFLRDPTPPSMAGQGDPHEFDAPTSPRRTPRSTSILRLSPVFLGQQGGLFLHGSF